MSTQFNFILLLVTFKMCCITGISAQTDCTSSINLSFNLDSCLAIGGIAPSDYSEFTPIIEESDEIRIRMISNSLYRINPQQNVHSCTPGRNGSTAMCISAYEYCNYQPGNYASLRFEVEVTSLTEQSARFSELTFWDKAPEYYTWTNGPSGINNYPIFFGVRILRDGVVVMQESEIPTARDWSFNNFDFSENDDFVVRDSAIFSIELLAYCPKGILSPYHVWDVEDINLVTVCQPNCPDIIDGGMVSLDNGLTEFLTCDQNSSLSITTSSLSQATNYQYILTETDGTIIRTYNSATTSQVVLDDLPSGVYRIYGLSSTTRIVPTVGANIGMLAVDECESLSTNFINVEKNIVEPGVLTGGPFSFCVGDGEPDIIPEGAIQLQGAEGENFQWVVTDITGTFILALPENISDINFDLLEEGTCVIWNVSSTGVVDELVVNSPFTCIADCMKRSNAVSIQKASTSGGTITAGFSPICLGTESASGLTSSSITIEGNLGADSHWIFTTPDGEIQYITDDFTDSAFLLKDNKSIILTHISSNGIIQNLVNGANISTLSGCFNLSNSLAIPKENVNGGLLEGGPFSFCVGDGAPDFIAPGELSLANNSGLSQWVITDLNTNEILSLPQDITSVNFDFTATGNCGVYNLSFETSPDRLEIGNLLDSISGCFSLSNPIIVERYDTEPASLSGGPFEFCVQDDTEDFLTQNSVIPTVQLSANQQFFVTDAAGTIIHISTSITDFDYNQGDIGNYFLYLLTYNGILTGFENGNDIFSLVGCFSISNPIEIIRNDCRAPLVGGNLTGGPYIFCRDGQADIISDLILLNNIGPNGQMVVTDSQDKILALPNDILEVDFEQFPEGTCKIYHVSFLDGLQGLSVGQNLRTSLIGEFSLSNFLDVFKGRPNGGTITGGPFEFCVGDRDPDYLGGASIQLMGNTASNSSWIVTDAAGSEILAVIDNPSDFDFNNTGVETNFIRHISFEDTVMGLSVGSRVEKLSGCYGLSNSIAITKVPLSGGTISSEVFYFCVGDGVPDRIPIGGITIEGQLGAFQQWVITNSAGTEILALPNAPEDIDFDTYPALNCLIWNVSYDDVASAPAMGQDFTQLGECISISNFITLFKVENDGGTISSSSVLEVCVGDGIPDMLPANLITLTGATGANSQWVLTDSEGIMLYLPFGGFQVIDFEVFEGGNCLLYHMSYDGPLTNFAANLPLSGVGGCLSLSNPLTINKIECGNGGTLIVKEVDSNGFFTLSNSSEKSLDLNNYVVYSSGHYTGITSLSSNCTEKQVLEPRESYQLNYGIELDHIQGELALFYQSPSSDAKKLIQYLNWGAYESEMIAEAIAKGKWLEGSSLTEIEPGKALIYDGKGIKTSDWSIGQPFSCLTSTEEPQTLRHRLYPNPVNTKLYLESMHQLNEKYTIEIINSLGQISFRQQGNPKDQIIEMDIADLQSGYYTIRISTTHGSTEYKIVKQ